MAPPSTVSAEVDVINYVKSKNALENANASEYMQLVSKTQVLEKTLANKLNKVENLDKKSVPKLLSLISNLFQSITNKGLFTHEIAKYIRDEIKKIISSSGGSTQDQADLELAIACTIGDMITIFHMDYGEFGDDEKNYILKHIVYNKDIQQFNRHVKKINSKDPKDYNLNNYLNFNRKQASPLSTVNTDLDNPTKENPSISAIMMHSNDMRCGVKNSLELSAFFNLISSLEYSKAYPYFNATFVLPSRSKQDITRVFKTATLNQFLFGSIEESQKTDNFRGFEGRITKDDKKIGVNTNLSIFTSPQTVVNMDEKFVGHNSNYEKKDRLRITTVHDKARPFMSLKDFTIDVSPTQGLMSFKTGKMSLVLHDRTRMVDIAPFIKPDLFGAFGAEIVVEYGWTHTQGREKDKNNNLVNPIGAFLETSRCVEKYMITNSQFTVENNGQVNINLSIAMKGPIDIRQTEIISDSEKALVANEFDAANTNFISSKTDFTTTLGLSGGGINFSAVNSSASSLFKGSALTQKEKNDLSKLKTIASHLHYFFRKVNLSEDKKKIIFTGEKNYSKRKEAIAKYISNSFFTNLKAVGSDAVYESDKAFTDQDKITSSISKISSAALSIKNIIDGYLTRSRAVEGRTKSYVESLIGGLNTEFFRSKLFDEKIIKITDSSNKNYKNIEKSYVDAIDKDSYITLGSLITSLVGTHMSATKKYDEIQIVFHTVNKNCGLASKISDKTGETLNIASIPILKSSLETYLKELFTSGATLTLESLISQVIVKFVMTKDNPMYGLSDLYRRENVSDPVKPIYKNKKFNSKKNIALDTPEARLNYFYYGDDKSSYDVAPQLVPPSIHLSFDTLTKSNFEDSSDTSFQATICRINVYDRNDNPYQELVNIYNSALTGNEGATTKHLKQLNMYLNIEKHIKSLEELLEKQKKEKKKKAIKATKALIKAEKKNLRERLGVESNETVTQALQAKLTQIRNALVKSDGTGIFVEKQLDSGATYFTFNDGSNFASLKEKYKKIVPSATFATQNTSLISASVATVNEGKLNTVYITRADRNNLEELNRNVVVDMPLRILPAQASIETFGCPWINFGQYIFLDFETGTTIDNTYAVTGIQHTITPGSFKTRVSLSYGDVYGKYEGYANTFSQLVKKLGDDTADAVSADGASLPEQNPSDSGEQKAKRQKRRLAKAQAQQKPEDTQTKPESAKLPIEIAPLEFKDFKYSEKGKTFEAIVIGPVDKSKTMLDFYSNENEFDKKIEDHSDFDVNVRNNVITFNIKNTEKFTISKKPFNSLSTDRTPTLKRINKIELTENSIIFTGRSGFKSASWSRGVYNIVLMPEFYTRDLKEDTFRDSSDTEAPEILATPQPDSQATSVEPTPDQEVLQENPESSAKEEKKTTRELINISTSYGEFLRILLDYPDRADVSDQFDYASIITTLDYFDFNLKTNTNAFGDIEYPKSILNFNKDKSTSSKKIKEKYDIFGENFSNKYRDSQDYQGEIAPDDLIFKNILYLNSNIKKLLSVDEFKIREDFNINIVLTNHSGNYFNITYKGSNQKFPLGKTLFKFTAFEKKHDEVFKFSETITKNRALKKLGMCKFDTNLCIEYLNNKKSTLSKKAQNFVTNKVNYIESQSTISYIKEEKKKIKEQDTLKLYYKYFDEYYDNEAGRFVNDFSNISLIAQDVSGNFYIFKVKLYDNITVCWNSTITITADISGNLSINNNSNPFENPGLNRGVNKFELLSFSKDLDKSSFFSNKKLAKIWASFDLIDSNNFNEDKFNDFLEKIKNSSSGNNIDFGFKSKTITALKFQRGLFAQLQINPQKNQFFAKRDLEKPLPNVGDFDLNILTDILNTRYNRQMLAKIFNNKIFFDYYALKFAAKRISSQDMTSLFEMPSRKYRVRLIKL